MEVNKKLETTFENKRMDEIRRVVLPGPFVKTLAIKTTDNLRFELDSARAAIVITKM